MGAECVLLREANALRNGALLWKAALYFFSQIDSTKITLKRTSFENLALNQTKIQCEIEIWDLNSQNSVYVWKLQAFLIEKIVSMGLKYFPDNFLIYCLLNMWKNVKPTRCAPQRKYQSVCPSFLFAFFTTNYPMELFEAGWFFWDIKSDPVPPFDIISSTFAGCNFCSSSFAGSAMSKTFSTD